MAGEIVTRSTAIASAQIMGEEEFDNVFRMARALAASGMFKDVTHENQAFGRILIGQDLGLSPTQALMTVDVVRGNVQLRGKLLLSWIRSSENYDYELLERSPERGSLQFYEKSKRTGEWAKVGPLKDPERPPGPDNPPGPIVFTLEQAKDKGLVKDGGGWDKWPENMCLWRCASIGFNLFCPDLSRGTPVYTEADSFVDSTATEISTGEGDGAPPGWDGLDDDLVEALDDVLTRAEKLAFPGLGDKATTQLRLNGQSRETVEEWLAAAREQLAMLEDA